MKPLPATRLDLHRYAERLFQVPRKCKCGDALRDADATECDYCRADRKGPFEFERSDE